MVARDVEKETERKREGGEGEKDENDDDSRKASEDGRNGPFR